MSSCGTRTCSVCCRMAAHPWARGTCRPRWLLLVCPMCCHSMWMSHEHLETFVFLWVGCKLINLYHIGAFCVFCRVHRTEQNRTEETNLVLISLARNGWHTHTHKINGPHIRTNLIMWIVWSIRRGYRMKLRLIEIDFVFQSFRWRTGRGRCRTGAAIIWFSDACVWLHLARWVRTRLETQLSK